MCLGEVKPQVEQIKPRKPGPKKRFFHHQTVDLRLDEAEAIRNEAEVQQTSAADVIRQCIRLQLNLDQENEV